MNSQPLSKLLLLLILMSGTTTLAANGQALLKKAANLAADSAFALQQNRIIVILISQEHCEFCERIKKEILNPLIRSGEYKKSLVIRELFIDFDVELIDFQGKLRAGRDIADDYGIDFTPTMLFLNYQGKSLAEPMIGLSTPELYPFYLQRSIDEAIAVQQQNAKL